MQYRSNPLGQPKHTLLRHASLLLWLLAMSAASALAAPPPADFRILNRAQATYVPSGHVLPETIHSNTVEAIVTAVESLQLTPDWAVHRPLGSIVTLPHILTNTGNIASTYTFNLANLSGDDFDLTTLLLVHDLDGDGVADPDEPSLTLGNPEITLVPGESTTLLVIGRIPEDSGTATARLLLTATTVTAVTASNTDTIYSRNQASVLLSKSADRSGIVYPGLTVNYHLVATNIGDSPARPSPVAGPLATPIWIDGAPATVFLIRDEIPAGTRYLPDSLATSLPNGIKLYRLPGDQPYNYRTNGDDAAAIEVATAATSFSLAPNVTTDMSFGVTVQAGFVGSLVNIGQATYDSGSGPMLSTSNQVVLQAPVQRIGLAKRAGVPAYEQDPVTRMLNGTARVHLSFLLESFSGVPLYNARIIDLLEGADRFGDYTANPRPGPGEYTVETSSARVVSLRNGASAVFNPAYTGAGSQNEILAPGANLPPGGALEVSFSVVINATGIDGLIYNTAVSMATLGNPTYGSVSDDSVNGSIPDANGDGNPTNDASPTPILLSLPAINVVKSAGEPRKVAGAGGTWDVDFTLTVTNTGKGVATYVRLADNLNCTFQTYRTPAPVLSWQLVGGPTARNGLLQINPAYTGAAECTADQIDGSSPYLAMPRDPALMLTDGTRHLDPGAAETINYSVRFVVDPLAKAEERVFTNIVSAGIFDRPTADGGQILAASESAVSVIPLDPSGVVYNSKTRQPVAGAAVRLRQESCESGGAGPLTAAELLAIPGVNYSFNGDGSVSMLTGLDGAYFFFLNSPPVIDNCEYILTVTPPATPDLIWPSTLIPPTPGNAPGGAVQNQDTAPVGNQATAYYLQVRLGPTLPIIINNHIPLDPTLYRSSLQLEKKGSKGILEIGDSLEYTLRLKNVAGKTLTGFTIVDQLPSGFRFIDGSARLDGLRIGDPAGAPGQELTFVFPALSLDNGKELTLLYRVVAGIATPPGEAINRATAYSGAHTSNQAAWRAQVEGGVFSEEAYLFGKVFLDCDGDGVQGHEEVGIPGVRLIMEDGTGVITDVEGKYSIYGLRAITHVLKLDTTTLPAGAHLGVIDNRNSAQGDSRFVDLKKGELHKANFAVDNCCDNPAMVAEVEHRRKALSARPDAEGEAVSKARLDLQPPLEPDPTDVRSRAASGELGKTGIMPLQVNTMTAPAGNAVFESVLPRDLAGPSSLPAVPLTLLPVVDLDSLLSEADQTLAFIDLADGDTLPMALTNVRVKGRLGSTLQLSVNGQVLSDRRVGKRARLADKQLEAWEYIGVELTPGRNILLLKEMDAFGNERGRREISLLAPGNIGRIEIEAPKTAVADPGSPIRIKVRLTDDQGMPVTVRTQLILEVDNGRWETKDLNPDEPGTQVFMQGGTAEFNIIPPNEPLDAIARVSSGILHQEVKIAYLPELRPLIGAGILEGVLDLRRKGLVPVNQSSRNAFEQTLRNMSRDSSDGEHSASGRAAFFFKGAVKGEYLLTVAFDSDKDTRERLFRDIQPDRFYPIYGDSSTKTFDAQSSGRFYLRIDKQKSWLLYGDFITDGDDAIRQLSKYSRAATGAKYHHESDRVSANLYANEDSLRQEVVEFPANGTSGPYQLSGTGEFYENSDKVEILVRDRHQPAVILKTIQMARFTDYMIEPLSGRLLFTAPVASLDENLNPRFIRVTYEVESGGPTFWMFGTDAQFKIDDRVQIGASYVRDDNPDNTVTLAGMTAVLKLGERSALTVEAAHSDTGLTGHGEAGRIEWMKDDGDLKMRAQAITADDRFDNPSSGFSKGRTEATANTTYQLDSYTSLRGEALYSKDRVTGGERKGALATVSTRLGEYLQGEIGIRAAEESEAPAQESSAGATPNDLLTLRARLGTRIPGHEGAQVYVEGEQDVRKSDKRMAAVGGDLPLGEKTRLYGRYEIISSLGSIFALNEVQEHNAAVIGIETAYLRDGRIFNEFRLRDSINGREALAATGVRQTWRVADGLRLGGSVEHTTAFGGSAGNDSTALTTSLEYTTNQRYRLFGSLEARFADAGDSWLNTLGLSYKLNKIWSLLARSAVSLQKNSSDASEILLSRQQIGLAWRQVDIDRWNGLGRYEYKFEDHEGGSSPGDKEAHIVSLHLNYQPQHTLIASGRYAFKFGRENYNDMSNDFQAHLLYGRVSKDLTRDLDASLQAACLWEDYGAAKYTLGVEAGYQLLNNLWLSLGYNLSGFRDDDLTSGEYTDEGVYLRLRFKFDERLFQ